MTKREVEEYIMSQIFPNASHEVTAQNVRNAFAPIVERVWTFLEGEIGDLSQLQTADKQSVVNAINAVLGKMKTDIDKVNADITNLGSKVGDLSKLVTSEKEDLVKAINETYAHSGGGGGGEDPRVPQLIQDVEDIEERVGDRVATSSNMGYVVLDKNKTFAEQVTKANTVYEIRYEFEVGGTEADPVEIPENCVLKFEGGRLKNGSIKGDFTKIDSNAENFILDNVGFTGFVCDSLSPEMFGAIGDGITDDTTAINRCLNSCISNSINFKAIGSNYAISNHIEINGANSLTLDFNKAIIRPLSFAGFTILPSAIYGSGVKMVCVAMANSNNSILKNLIIEGIDRTSSDLQFGLFVYNNKSCIAQSLKMSDISYHHVYVLDCKMYFDDIEFVNLGGATNCSDIFQSSHNTEVKYQNIRSIRDARDSGGQLFYLAEGKTEIDGAYSQNVPVVVDQRKDRCVATHIHAVNALGILVQTYVTLGEGESPIDITITDSYFDECEVYDVYKSMLYITCCSRAMIRNVHFTAKENFESFFHIRNILPKYGTKNVVVDNCTFKFAEGKTATAALIVLNSLEESPIIKNIKLETTGTSSHVYVYSSEGENLHYNFENVYITGGNPRIWNRTENVIYKRFSSIKTSKLAGTTDDRPTLYSYDKGNVYFDTTLNRPIWWNGTEWVDMNTTVTPTLTTGTEIVDINGTKIYAPTSAGGTRPTLTTTNKGYQFFDTTLNKPIFWTGSKWVDATGADV